MESKVKCNMNSLSFMITDKCNLKCSFCSRNALIGNEQFMSPEFIKSQIEEAMKFTNLKTVNLSGGEPFLHPQIEEILKIIREKNLIIRINTNGLLFNEKNLNLIDKYKVEYFTISLDSSIPEIHDEIRGVKGVFNKTVENLTKIKDRNCKFFIKATVTPSNVESIFDLMKFAESLWAFGFSFSRTIPIGRASEIDDYQNKEFIQKYFEMGRKCSEYAKSSKMQLLIDDPIRHQFDTRIDDYLKEHSDLSHIWGGCTAGCNFLYIQLNKDVLACTAITEPCGNLNTESLYEIWENSKQLVDLRTRKNLKGKCSSCKRKEICGGCRAYALATTGDINGEDKFCKRYY